MAKMLRTGASHEFGCCDACDHHGGNAGGRKARKRERKLARAREKQAMRKNFDDL